MNLFIKHVILMSQIQNLNCHCLFFASLAEVLQTVRNNKFICPVRNKFIAFTIPCVYTIPSMVNPCSYSTRFCLIPHQGHRAKLFSLTC